MFKSVATSLPVLMSPVQTRSRWKVYLKRRPTNSRATVWWNIFITGKTYSAAFTGTILQARALIYICMPLEGVRLEYRSGPELNQTSRRAPCNYVTRLFSLFRYSWTRRGDAPRSASSAPKSRDRIDGQILPRGCVAKRRRIHVSSAR